MTQDTTAFADLPNEPPADDHLWVAVYKNDHGPTVHLAETAQKAAVVACNNARSTIPTEQTHWNKRNGAFVLDEYEEFGLDRYQESIVLEERPVHAHD